MKETIQAAGVVMIGVSLTMLILTTPLDWSKLTDDEKKEQFKKLKALGFLVGVGSLVVASPYIAQRIKERNKVY